MLIEPLILAVAASLAVTVSYCASLFAARSQHILDHPNGRSSHAHATPRTGGLAIMAGWLAGLFVIAVFSANADLAITAAALSLTALFALAIGLGDDRLGLTPLWKFVGQIAAAALFTVIFGPLAIAPLPYVGDVALAPFWGVTLTIVWIVAFMNVFNFMDGANGLAAGAAAVGLAWMSVTASFAGAPALAVTALLLALSVAGFLPENLKRGKLFMGDNGSQALGFLIAAFAILGVKWTDGRMCALVVPVIFMPFLFDVSWTLASRLIRKQNILQGHREHLYQLLMRTGGSHAGVAIAYMGLVSLSAAASILMLTLPSSLHWLAPTILAIAFAITGTAIYKNITGLGLLKDARSPATATASTPAQ